MRKVTRTTRTAPADAHANEGTPQERHGDWLRHPAFWLALALGAFLRLWHIELTQFLYDQAGLMTLARGAILRHAVPITGIGSSIHTYNSPLSIYLLIPFVALGKDPLLAAIVVALWNIGGIALSYLFTLRFFGRRVAAISALLLAASGKAVIYSRFIWQQNFLSPLLVLWAFTLYAGCVHGRRGWLAPNLALLALIVALHPTGLLLAPLVVVGVLLGPHPPRPREYALSAGIIAALLAPTVMWEVVSRGADFEALRRLGARPARIDLDIVGMLHELVGGPTFPFANVGHTYAVAAPGSLYAAFRGVHQVMALAVAALYGAGFLTLTALVVMPARTAWIEVAPAGRPAQRLASSLGAIWRTLRADPIWRGRLLLWLWVVLPPLFMVRHTTPIYVHYLLLLFPAVCVMVGVAAHWALSYLTERPARLPVAQVNRTGAWRIADTLRAQVGPGRGHSLPRALVLAMLGLFVAVAAAQSALFIAAQANGAVDTTYYGYPLQALRGVDVTLTALQHREGATAVYIGTRRSFYADALRYLLVDEEPGRIEIYGTCLVLPAPSAGPALIVSTAPAGSERALLGALSTARHVTTLAMPGNDPFTIYRVSGSPASLPSETALAPVVYRNGDGAALRLDAGAWEVSGTLRLRWTVLAASRAGAASQSYTVAARALDTSGRSGRLLAQGSCDSTRWRLGETIFTWLPSTAPLASQRPAAARASLAAQPLAIEVGSHSFAHFAPTLGPLRLLSSRLDATPTGPGMLMPSLAASDAAAVRPGALTPAGDFVLPNHALADGSPAP